MRVLILTIIWPNLGLVFFTLCNAFLSFTMGLRQLTFPLIIVVCDIQIGLREWNVVEKKEEMFTWPQSTWLIGLVRCNTGWNLSYFPDKLCLQMPNKAGCTKVVSNKQTTKRSSSNVVLSSHSFLLFMYNKMFMQIWENHSTTPMICNQMK